MNPILKMKASEIAHTSNSNVIHLDSISHMDFTLIFSQSPRLHSIKLIRDGSYVDSNQIYNT